MQSPFSKEVYERNAEIYKLLSNAKRLEILNILKVKEQSVENLVKMLKLPKANVSQHLALLRHARLVTVERDGLHALYSIVDPMIVEPCRILRDLWQNNEYNRSRTRKRK